MRAETIAFSGGGNLNYSLHIDGLPELMRFLKGSDLSMREALRRGMRTASKPVLTRARANARKIADDGTYAESLSIRTYVSGRVTLHATDVAAPVKEFAKPGAVTRTSKGTPLADARLRKRSGVGVPKRANAPRVMIPAVNDSIEDVKSGIEAELEKVLGRVANG